MIKNSILMFSLILAASSKNVAAEPEIGQSLLVRGEVSILPPHSLEAHQLKRGEKIKEDSSILTGSKSFARIKLDNGSVLNLGPKSKMVIVLMKKEEESIISMLKGKVRAKVNKKEKEHFFIKSKTAALGVRGTEFVFHYNPETQKSSVLTYEGKVVVNKAKIMAKESEPVTLTKELIKVTSKKESVTLEPGDFTTVAAKEEVPVEPVKIDYKQFALLKKDESLGTAVEELSDVEIEKEVERAKEIYKISKVEHSNKIEKRVLDGGLIALEEDIYIPPKINNEKKEIELIGSIEKDGSFKAPENLKLDAKKGFVPVTETQEVVEEAAKINKIIENEVEEPEILPEKDDPAYNKYFDIDDD